MVRVRVPATTSNIGTGFDILGLALNLYNEFEGVLIAKDDIIIEYEINSELYGRRKRRIELPKGKKSVIYRSFIKLFERYNESPRGIYIRSWINIPVYGGLGSSATAILGGLFIAKGLLKRYYGYDVPLSEIYEIAVDMEGHPDNVTPAIFGGFTLSYRYNGGFSFVKLPFPSDMKIVVLSPLFSIHTDGARKLLPNAFPMDVAVEQMSRLALLIRAFYENDYSLLSVAVDDKFHEPYRGELIPGFYDIKKAGYDSGALAVFLSGAGSSIAAFCLDSEKEIARNMKKILDKKNIESKIFILQPDFSGSKIEE
jgi:homoserine kinase